MKQSATSPTRLTVIVYLFFILIVAAMSFKVTERVIPKTWDLAALQASHLPPPVPGVHVEFPPESYYNALPEHIIYKSYPVYAQGYGPPGYLDSLRRLELEIVFNPDQIRSDEDWIKAGEHVFFWPANLAPPEGEFGSHLDSAYFAGSGDQLAKDGIYPFARYVVTAKGVVRYGDLSCATCHSRVMDNGEVIIGAQGNHAFDSGFGYIARKFHFPTEQILRGQYMLSGTPWVANSEAATLSLSRDVYLADLMARPNGVMSRQGMGLNLPIAVPSLIGVKDIKYLDNTGLMRHESLVDLMRYAALNQGMDMLISYDGFVPLDRENFSDLPAPSEWRNPFGYDPMRYSDAQLYALAQYIYALRPPENPYDHPAEVVNRGERIFIEEGCVTCHTPPLYTNNMLTPAEGFEPPPEHLARYDIFNISVETDPRTALQSRRGTGYYKIPSLRGVWFKGPFFHNGELATLEDVFDPARLRDDYVPTGFKASTVATKSVPGHDFGMDLASEDKSALIAYLKTL